MKNENKRSIKSRFLEFCGDVYFYDGLRIIILDSDDSHPLQLLQDALALIRKLDPIRWARLKRDLVGGVRVYRPMLHYAQFDGDDMVCELRAGDDLLATSREELAAVIVHEATHARLEQRGIGYEPSIRVRVEEVCIRREIAFAKRIPDGQSLVERLEAQLRDLDPDYYTDAAFELRGRRLKMALMRSVRRSGVSNWSIRFLSVILRGIRSLVQGVCWIMSAFRFPQERSA